MDSNLQFQIREETCKPTDRLHGWNFLELQPVITSAGLSFMGGYMAGHLQFDFWMRRIRTSFQRCAQPAVRTSLTRELAVI